VAAVAAVSGVPDGVVEDAAGRVAAALWETRDSCTESGKLKTQSAEAQETQGMPRREWFHEEDSTVQALVKGSWAR
jgi:hypothetical protein